MYIALKLFNEHRSIDDLEKLKNLVDQKNAEPLCGSYKWFIIETTPMDYNIFKQTGKILGDFNIIYDPYDQAEKASKVFTNTFDFKRTVGGR